MPIGIYPHKPQQGFQKGHKGFNINYATRHKPRFSEEYLKRLREIGKTLGKYSRTDKHRLAQRQVASRVIARLHGRIGTWIEKRFEMFLQDFGLKRDVNYLVQPTVFTSRTHRFPDFLLANDVIIEVDGACWHDPWKDYLRDLDLMEAGYKVFHFTGKKINANPIECCDRLIKIVNDFTLEERYAS